MEENEMKKRWLSLLMSVCLCVSVLPVRAAAEESGSRTETAGTEMSPGEETPWRDDEECFPDMSIEPEGEWRKAKTFGQPRVQQDVPDLQVRYTEDFPESGIRVSILAQEGAIPENAAVEILPLEDSDEMFGEVIRQKAQQDLEEKSLEAGGGVRSIYNMYTDLEVSVESSQVFQIGIVWQDEQGGEHLLRPEEDGTIQVRMEMLEEEQMPQDDMQSLEVFSLTESIPAVYSGEQENPSVYAVSAVRYSAKAADDMTAAQQKAWEIIRKYADVEYFLTDPYRSEMTEEQYEELHQAAVKATEGCATQYEKIQKIVEFVAKRVYYDYCYAEGLTDTVYINPYEVYTEKLAVCSGYARLTRTMLISLGIPCMDIIGEAHEYNIIYDSGKSAWIFADPSWSSGNQYTVEKKWVTGEYHDDMFDLTPEEIAALDAHGVYALEGLQDESDKSVYYSLVTMEEDWDDGEAWKDWSRMDWYMTVSGATQAEIKPLGSLAGFPVKGVAKWALGNDRSLSKVDLTDTSVEKIGYAAFYGCSSLVSVTLPDSLKEVGDWAFGACGKLKEMNLSGTQAARIGEYGFYNCLALAQISFPNTLTAIGKRAFLGCAALKEADLSGTQTAQIGEYAFYNCTALEKAVYPAALAQMDTWAFGNCASLAEVDLSGSRLTGLNYAVFYGGSSLKKISLPGALTEVGDWAFGDCRVLPEINLADTKVTSIGSHGFYNCLAAEVIRLPETLTRIGAQAFAYTGVPMTMVVTTLSPEALQYPGDNGEWLNRKITVCSHVYRVEFDGNGASGGTMDSRIFGGSVEYKLPQAGYERLFYDFAGWNSRQDGSGISYEDGAVVKDLSEKDGDSVTLYAQWKDASHMEGDLTCYRDHYYYVEDGVLAVSKEAVVNGAWRWFDADGTMAVDKDVYQNSFAGPYGDKEDGTGKWVRYNEKGEMVKGEDYRNDGWYRFDETTGAMVKGWYTAGDGSVYYYDWGSGQMVHGPLEIDGVPCWFDENTGAGADCVWITQDGREYWYENGVRQGLEGRGKEIYDPASGAWYWLDSVDQGRKAVGKDVYQESLSAYPDREDGTGKWVRYDENGHMVKGWQTTEAGTYYFEEVTGAMAKGTVEIDGVIHTFDTTTGILVD